MKRVLLLATTTGYQIRSFGDAAQKLDVRVSFASDRCDQLDDPWRDHAIAVRFHDTSASINGVLRAFDGTAPAGIIAVGDRPVVLTAYLAEAFGLPWHPVAGARASRNKLIGRSAMEAAGMRVPSFQPISFADAPLDVSRTLSYPVVVKPLAMSGSRGVIRANDKREFVEAFERLRTLCAQTDVLLERDPAHAGVLVESFIPGRELAIEGLMTNGSLAVLAIFDKPDPLDGPYFEESIYITPSLEPQAVQDAIVREVASAASALGLRHGPIHAECRVNDRGVHMLEIAARPIGGLCSRALRFVSPRGDASLEELLLRHATGEDVRLYTRERAASGVMMIPIPRAGIYKGVRGDDEARKVPDVTDVRITAKADSTLVPLPEGRSYLGFIFARSASPQAVEQALRAACAKLRFTIDREIALV
jgi:biotin carboxylase